MIYGRVIDDTGEHPLARVAYEHRLAREMASEEATFVRLERRIPAGGWDEEQQVNVDGFAWTVDFERMPAAQASRFTWGAGDLVQS